MLIQFNAVNFLLIEQRTVVNKLYFYLIIELINMFYLNIHNIIPLMFATIFYNQHQR